MGVSPRGSRTRGEGGQGRATGRRSWVDGARRGGCSGGLVAPKLSGDDSLCTCDDVGEKKGEDWPPHDTNRTKDGLSAADWGELENGFRDWDLGFK